MFDEVARNPQAQYRFAVGRELALAVGYPEPILGRLPSHAAATFTGLSYLHPFLAAGPGERVLDLGCGAGLDSVLLADAVVPSGSVVGVDLAPRMIERARQLAIDTARAPYTTFEVADATDLPFMPDTFDAALVNGFLNLCPDKASVAQELRRVLRDRGRAVIAEITYTVPPAATPLRSASDWFR